MQNEPNFPDDQMNITSFYTADYENIANWTLGENKPKTNPIKANTKPIKANTKPIKANSKPIKAKTNPIQTQNEPNLLDAQMNVNKVLTKDYENVPLRRRGENKPNQTQFQTAHLLIDRMKHKFLNFLLKNPADTKNPPKNLMSVSCDLPTNKILASMAAAGDNKNQISIENFRNQ